MNSEDKDHPLQPPAAMGAERNSDIRETSAATTTTDSFRKQNNQFPTDADRCVSMGLVLPYTVFPHLSTPRTELAKRGSGSRTWSQTIYLHSSKKIILLENLVFLEPHGWSKLFLVLV